MEISAADIDPQPKRNQKPRPKKQTVGKPKLTKTFGTLLSIIPLVVTITRHAVILYM